MTDQTDHGRDPGAIAARWWRETFTETGQGRMVRAKLRRAETPLDALTIAATHALNRRLAEAGLALDRHPDTLALIAVVLARVEENGGGRLASRFGQPLSEERRLLSETRFQAIVRTHERRALARLLRRALPLVRERADVAALARDLFHWSDKTRERWCFEYYGAAANDPTTPETTGDPVT